MKWEDIRDIAEEMCEADKDRDDMYEKIDKLVHMDWELPAEWKSLGWITAIKSSEPYDIIHAGTRVLATRQPRIQITPLHYNPETRAHFNQIETALMWQYKQASRRTHANPTRNIVESALRYDEIAAQVVYLPYQNKSLKAIKGNRLKRAEGYGPFSINVHNPRTVHVRYSDWMPEAVVLEKRMPVYKIVKFWGELAGKLESEFADALTEEVTLYDYMDEEYRCVWVETEEGSDDKNKILILSPTEHKLGFLPWACRIGGTTLDDQSDENRNPILYSNVKTEAYHTQNLFGSLMISLAMARATLPVDDVTSPTGDGIDVDATVPAGQYAHDTATRIQRLPPVNMDPNVKEMYDRMAMMQSRSAGTKVLQTGDVPPGTAFATLNAMMKAATSVLDPTKDLAEGALGDVFGHMVAWAKWDKEPLWYYIDDKRNNQFGKQQKIDQEKIPEPQDLYLDVKLEVYVPTDEMSKVNAAVMLTQNFPYPYSRALETLGVYDPEKAFEEWSEEQKAKAATTEEVKDISFEADMARQQAQQQQQMQQQQMQAQQQGAQQPQQGMFPGGEGANPAMGGMPSQMGAPGMTRETMGGGAPPPADEGADFRGLKIPPEQMTGRESVK
jgi:hypothetical protein